MNTHPKALLLLNTDRLFIIVASTLMFMVDHSTAAIETKEVLPHLQVAPPTSQALPDSAEPPAPIPPVSYALTNTIWAYQDHNWIDVERWAREVLQDQTQAQHHELATLYLAIAVSHHPGTPSQTEAIQLFKQLTRHATNQRLIQQAQWRLGDLYLNKGWTAEAEGLYRQLITSAPPTDETARGRLGLAMLYLHTNRVAEASRHLTHLLQHNPPALLVPYGHLGLAHAASAQRQYVDAIDHYEYLQQTAPDFLNSRLNALLSYADTLAHLTRYHGAALIYERIVNLYPTHDLIPHILLRLGDLHRLNLDDRHAAMFYREVLTVPAPDSTHEVATLRLAALHTTGPTPSGTTHDRQTPADMSPPIDILRGIMDKHPTDVVGSEARYALGRAHETLNDPTQAIPLYRHIATLDRNIPGNPWPAIASRRLLELLTPSIQRASAKGQDLEVLAWYAEMGGEATTPYHPPAETLIVADAYRRQGFHTPAMSLYHYLLKTPGIPRDIQDSALYHLGQVYVQQRDDAAAQRMFTQYRLRFPTGHWKAENLYALASVRARQGQTQQALDAAQQWLKQYPTHGRKPEILYLLATAAETLNDPDLAMTTYTKAAATPILRNPASRLRYAHFLEQQHHRREAKTHYQQIVETTAPSIFADLALLHLTELARDEQQPDQAQAAWTTLQTNTRDPSLAKLATWSIHTPRSSDVTH